MVVFYNLSFSPPLTDEGKGTVSFCFFKLILKKREGVTIINRPVDQNYFLVAPYMIWIDLWSDLLRTV